MSAFTLNMGSKGWDVRDVKGDGACQFQAVLDQLCGNDDYHEALRGVACAYMRRHATRFRPFAWPEEWEHYMDKLATPERWGDNVSLVAIAEIVGIEIRVYQSSDRGGPYIITPREGMDVWEIVPISQCIQQTSKRPIRGRWVDVNEGDGGRKFSTKVRRM